MNKEERIKFLKAAIKQMYEDEKIFGLVREDRDKILEWKLEIRELENEK